MSRKGAKASGETPAPDAQATPTTGTPPVVDYEVQGRILAAIRELGSAASVTKVQTVAKARRSDVAHVLAEVRAGRLDPKAPPAPRPAVDLERLVRSAATAGDLARVTATAAAEVAAGRLEPARSRAIIDASRESRRAMADQAKAVAAASKANLIDEVRMALVSPEMLELAKLGDYLCDERRELLMAYAADLLEAENLEAKARHAGTHASAPTGKGSRKALPSSLAPSDASPPVQPPATAKRSPPAREEGHPLRRAARRELDRPPPG